MATLQVKNVPDPVHRRIRRCAAEQRKTVSALVLDAVDRELRRTEFLRHLRRRRSVDLGRPAAKWLEEARAEHEGRFPR